MSYTEKMRDDFNKTVYLVDNGDGIEEAMFEANEFIKKVKEI